MRVFQQRGTGFGGIVVAALVALTSCGGSDGGGPMGSDGETARVVFSNHLSSELPIHILAPGEDFDESNRLEPGASRTVDVAVPDLLVVEFRAGRNGAVVASLFCAFTGDEGEESTVLWFMGTLFCEGGFESA